MSASAEFTPKLFTLLQQGYTKAQAKADFLAGLTVAIVALPLSMALAIASGASPDKGLVTAVIAGFLISFLGGSRVQIGGPTGAFVVVVSNVIAIHGYDGLIMATLLAGVMLVISGYLRLGQVIKFIPHPVVTGFTAGIAVIIASSQVKDFLGLRLEHVPADFLPKWQAYLGAIGTVDAATLMIGIGALMSIILIRKYAPKLPGYLIAVVAASVVVLAFQVPVETIGSRFPVIPSGLPMPSLPVWDYAKFKEIIPSAFTIAFLAGIEALLSAVVADGMTGHKHRSNQELVGQGVANVASALFGGLPATGAIARTATNIKSGGLTPVSGMLHAVFILIFMLFANDLMKFVPMAALAAILFIVAWGMSEIDKFIHILRLSMTDRVVMVLTFGLTVLVDLTVAIAVGVTLAALLFMRHMTTAVEMQKGVRSKATEVDDDEEPKDKKAEDQRRKLPEGVEVFRINGPLFFGVAGDLMETFKSFGEMPKVLIIRMGLVPYMDGTGATAIHNLLKSCAEENMKVILSGVQSQPKTLLHKAGVKEDGQHIIFAPTYEASLKLASKLVQE